MSFRKLRGRYDNGRVNRFTAAADVEDGDVIVHNTRVGVVHDEEGAGIATGEQGLAIFGTDEKGIYMPKATGALTANQKLYWDEDGTPIVGTALSGAVTATPTANLYIGRAVIAAASADGEALVHLTDE